MRKQTGSWNIGLWLSLGLMLWPRNASSQLDSLVDVFPLAEGNRWVYGWNRRNTNTYVGQMDDTGTVDLTVTHKIESADSIRWFLWQRRSLRKGPPGYNYLGAWSEIADSGFVEVVEKLQGRHQLISSAESFSFLDRYVLDLYPHIADSARIYRYARMDTLGRYDVHLSDYPPFASAHYVYSFEPGLGLSALTINAFWAYPHSAYTDVTELLRSATLPGAVHPMCGLADRFLFIQAALGQTSEQVVTVSNPGTGTLQLSSATCSNPHFDLILLQRSVPVNSNAPLYVRYLYQAPMADTARIVLMSNAPSSPDTIVAFVWAPNPGDTTQKPPWSRPRSFALEQNFPNPFNTQTTMRFDLPSPASVALKVFDLLGQEVATVMEGPLEAGSYTRMFSGAGLSSGVYLYRLQAGEFAQVRRMILMR